MMITAKELAKKLNMSAAAVSMALNNKSGVSTETRKLVIAAAQEYGYDFTKLYSKQPHTLSISFISFRKKNTLVASNHFFSHVTDGMAEFCQEIKCKLSINCVYSDCDLEAQLEQIAQLDYSGFIVLGTEMTEETFSIFKKVLCRPILLLDACLDLIPCNCVIINNIQGAFSATDYLISKTQAQPGYLQSSYNIYSFEQRADGFYKAVKRHGLSPAMSIVHKLAPSIEGAYADMLEILNRGEDIARCYFADNDLIAIGAIRAFQAKGIKIPDDVSIIGYDNIRMAEYIDPPLTTINVPKQYYGKVAVIMMLYILSNQDTAPIKCEISTEIIERKSV